jgi:hypothetical protein
LLLAKTLALSQTRFFESQTKPSRDLRGQASTTLRADHRRQLIPPRTPEAQVAAKLSLQARTLREQYPGAEAQAPRQKDAHIERRPRPRRTDDGVLAYANKAEAATTSELKLAKQLLLSDERNINSLVERAMYETSIP